MSQQPPEDHGPTLKEIGYFRVTKRGLERYQDELKFQAEELKPNSWILDIGSGRNQNLAQDLKAVRPDITVVSTDPSLALPPNQLELSKLGITYDIPPAPNEKRLGTTNEDLKARLENISPNTLAAIAPHLPFAEGSFDYVFDNHGAYLYLDDKRLPKYVKEITRVLKSGGMAAIYPLDLYDEATGLSYAEKYQRSQVRIKLLLSRAGIKRYELYDHIEYPKMSKDKRVGVKFFKG